VPLGHHYPVRRPRRAHRERDRPAPSPVPVPAPDPARGTLRPSTGRCPTTRPCMWSWATTAPPTRTCGPGWKAPPLPPELHTDLQLWLNVVKRWFRNPTGQAIRCGDRSPSWSPRSRPTYVIEAYLRDRGLPRGEQRRAPSI